MSAFISRVRPRSRGRRTARSPAGVVMINEGAMRVGADLDVAGSPVRTHIVVGPAGSLTLGDRVRIGHGSGISCSHDITVGNDVNIGPFVLAMDSDFHVSGRIEEDPEPRPIYVGDGVRIGAWTIILPGAWIGDHAIVAPGSVVGGRIESGCYAGGNPATSRQHYQAVEGSDVRARVVAVATGLFNPLTPIERQTTKDELAMWNSLGAVQFLVGLEEAFVGIKIQEHRFMTATSIGDVVDLVQLAWSAAER